MAATTLTWNDVPGLGDGLTTAASARPLPAQYTGAYFTIERDPGLRSLRPDVAQCWHLTYRYQDSDGDADEVELGRHADEESAKTAAERYEQTGTSYARADDATLRQFNLDARLSPQNLDYERTRPCITVAGVEVFVYLDERTGHLVVSVVDDNADEAVQDSDGHVPMQIKVGGEPVFNGWWQR